MARKLKTYQTSQGFFDLVIAAPSMKAALAAWGARSNLFHQGFAKEVDDASTVAAALAKPGIVLKRPVGSDEPFQEHAHLPTLDSLELPPQRSRRPAKPAAKRAKKPAAAVDERTARKAALAYERQQQQQEKQRRRDEAAAAKARQRRQAAMAAAKAALDEASGEHDRIMAGLDDERGAIEQRMDAEQARWEKARQRLEAALRRASEF